MNPPSSPSAPFSPPQTPLDPPTISTSILLSDLSDPSHTYTSPTFHWESDCFELPPEMRITWDTPSESVKLTIDEASAIGYEVLPLPQTQDRERELELAGALERLEKRELGWNEERSSEEHLMTPGRVNRAQSVRSLCTSPLLTHHSSCRRDKSATKVATSSTHDSHALPEHEGLPVRFDSWIHSDRDHAGPTKPPAEQSEVEASALKPLRENPHSGTDDDHGRYATPELSPDIAEADSAGTSLSLPRTPPPLCAVDTITIDDKVVTLSGDSVAIQSIKSLLKTHMSTSLRDPGGDLTPVPRTHLREPESPCHGIQLLRGYLSTPAPASTTASPDRDKGDERTAPREFESESISSTESPSKDETMTAQASGAHALDEDRAAPDTDGMTKQHAGQSQQLNRECPPSPPTVTVWRPSSTPEPPDVPHQSSLRPQTPQRPKAHLLPQAPSPWSSTSSQRFRFHEEQYEFQHLAAGMPEQMRTVAAGLHVKQEAMQLSPGGGEESSRSGLDILASEAAKKVGKVTEDEQGRAPFSTCSPKFEVLNPARPTRDDLFTKDDKRAVLKSALLMDLSPKLAISMQDLISGQTSRQTQCRLQDWLPVGVDPLGSDSIDASTDSEDDTPVKKAISRYMTEDGMAQIREREESLPPLGSLSAREESRSPSPPPRKKPAPSKKNRAAPKKKVQGSVDHASEDQDIPSQASLREQILTIGPLDEAPAGQPSYQADELDKPASENPARKVTRQSLSRKRQADVDEDQQDGEEPQEDDSVASRLQMRQASQWQMSGSGKKARMQIKSDAEKAVKPKRKVAAPPQASSSRGSKASRSKTTFIPPTPVRKGAAIALSKSKRTAMTIISPIGSSFTATTGREPSEDPLALTAVQDEDLDQYGDEDAEGEEDDGVEYTAEDLVNMAEDGEMNGGESEGEDRKRVQFRRETRAAKVRDKKAQKKGTVQESAHQRQYGPEEDAILREVWASKSSFHTVKEVFAEAQARLLEAGYRERSLDALKYRMTSSASKFVAQYSPRKVPQPQRSQTTRGGKQ